VKSIKLSFFLMILSALEGLFVFEAHADVKLAEPTENKKYKVSICSVFKNEDRYLKEWVEYHRLIGVDHFYLYNNVSRDRSAEVLQPYINEGLVTLFFLRDRMPSPNQGEDATHWVLSTLLPAYECVAKYTALKDTEWLLFLDIDEFLVPVQTSHISEILDKYDKQPAMYIACDYFEASHIDVLSRRDLLIATTELIAEPSRNIQMVMRKTIFKPDQYTSFTWPPYNLQFKNEKFAKKINKNELKINKYVNRFNGQLNFGKVKEKIRVDNRLLTEDEIEELLKIGFEIDDQDRVIFKFAPELEKRLKRGWE
jgi:hypothetical protein